MEKTLWIPGAVVIPVSLDGGSMMGTGESYATVHTYESKGYGLSATEAAKRLIAAGHACTVTYNPVTGEYAQMVPANRASRTLVNLSGGVQTNRAGSFHFQVEVIGDAARPWTQDITDAGKRSWGIIQDWCRAWGVPDIWRVLPPVYPPGVTTKIGPAGSGWYPHAGWRENTHGDPGNIDTQFLFTLGSPIVIAPPPPPITIPHQTGPTPPAGFKLEPDTITSSTPLRNGLWSPPGGKIYRMQAELARNFFYARNFGLKGPDGRFGDITEKAVKEFQRRVWPRETPDGLVGPRTWQALKNNGCRL